MKRQIPIRAPVAVITALYWAAVLAIPSPVSAASVSGTVRDAVTLDPVAGISLTLHVLDPDSVAFSTTSDPSGEYSISGAPGDNRIYVLVGGGSVYANFYARLPIPDPTLTFDVLLDSLYVPQPGEPEDSSAVTGRVVTGSGNLMQGVPNANVILSYGGSSYLGITDREGYYDMVLPPGTYSGEVAADGYEPVSDSGLEVAPGGLSYNAYLVPSTADVPPTTPGVIGIRAIQPNPVRVSTEIHYVLAGAGNVELAVYDLTGRVVSRVASGWTTAGPHVATFSAARLPAGIYFCRLEAAGLAVSRRLAVLP